MSRSQSHLAVCLDFLLECIDSKLHIHSLTFKRKLHFSSESPWVMFFLLKGNSDVSISLMIPLSLAKLCEVDERIRGQNLFQVLGEVKSKTVPIS